jgi:hypothetical protein
MNRRMADRLPTPGPVLSGRSFGCTLPAVGGVYDVPGNSRGSATVPRPRKVLSRQELRLSLFQRLWRRVLAFRPEKVPR